MGQVYSLPVDYDRVLPAPPLDEVEVYHLIQQFKGNMSEVARELGRSRVSVMKFVNSKKLLIAVRKEITDQLLDLAEANYVKAVEEGDLVASRFVLETLGKDRGYTRRVEQTGLNGGPITSELQVRFVKPGEEIRDAVHQEGIEDHALHEEELRSEEGRTGVLRFEKQGQDQGGGEEREEA